jgi:hypothetical protein
MLVVSKCGDCTCRWFWGYGFGGFGKERGCERQVAGATDGLDDDVGSRAEDSLGEKQVHKEGDINECIN